MFAAPAAVVSRFHILSGFRLIWRNAMCDRSKFTPKRIWNRGINPRTRSVRRVLFLEMLAKHGAACKKCGRRDVVLYADHVKPWAKGGLTVLENLQPLCKRCNEMKGARHAN